MGKIKTKASSRLQESNYFKGKGHSALYWLLAAKKPMGGKSQKGSSFTIKFINGIIKKYFSPFQKMDCGYNRFKNSVPVFKGVEDYYEKQKFGVTRE